MTIRQHTLTQPQMSHYKDSCRQRCPEKTAGSGEINWLTAEEGAALMGSGVQWEGTEQKTKFTFTDSRPVLPKHTYTHTKHKNHSLTHTYIHTNTQYKAYVRTKHTTSLHEPQTVIYVYTDLKKVWLRLTV